MVWQRGCRWWQSGHNLIVSADNVADSAGVRHVTITITMTWGFGNPGKCSYAARKRCNDSVCLRFNPVSDTSSPRRSSSLRRVSPLCTSRVPPKRPTESYTQKNFCVLV
nr:PREDICTED: uncharacterized protein LOC109041477 [Bemisia tabaci]